MTSPLENLVKIGQLKKEAPADGEVAGLVSSGTVRLADAKRTELNLESRFDLAYNAAHALALAALRLRGLRSENRYLVFQTLSRPARCDAPRRRRGGEAREGLASRQVVGGAPSPQMLSWLNGCLNASVGSRALGPCTPHHCHRCSTESRPGSSPPSALASARGLLPVRELTLVKG